MGEGLSVLYVLADDWIYRRNVLHLLGARAENLSPLDELLSTPPQQVAQSTRAQRIIEFAALTGGEIATAEVGGG